MPINVARFSLGTPPREGYIKPDGSQGFRPQFFVRLPGWDDIIHLTPTALRDPEEVKAERQQRAIDALRSPSPDVVEHFSRIGQEIDNVQDALVTLSVLGRVAAKVTGRAIPGVGAIATAADALNMMNIFYPRIPSVGALPALTHVTEGGRRLRRWAASPSRKRELGQLMGLATGLYRSRLADTVRTGRIGFGWGEALQVLQTTDQLAGFGVSLGPIFGAATDTFFGLIRGARFDVSGPIRALNELALGLEERILPAALIPQPGFRIQREATENLRIEVDFPGVGPLVDKLYGHPEGQWEKDAALVLGPIAEPVDRAAVAALSAFGAIKTATVSAAQKVWEASKWLVGVRGLLSWEDHVEILVAQFLALQELKPFLQQTDWVAAGQRAAEKGGIAESIPFVDRVTTGQSGALSSALRDGPARFPLDWADEAPTPEAAVFTRSLISSFVDLFFECLEGPGAKVESRASDSGRALLAMHDHDLLPPFERLDPQLATYIAGVSDVVRSFDSVLPPRALMEKAWRESFSNSVLE